MLDSIFKGIQTIVQFFEAAWTFVVQLFADIGNLVSLLKEWLLAIPDLLGFLPASIVTLIVTGFGIVVLYKILGREG